MTRTLIKRLCAFGSCAALGAGFLVAGCGSGSLEPDPSGAGGNHPGVAGTSGAAGTAGINLPNVWIAFDSDRDFNRDIYMIRPDGTDLTRLTSEPGIEKEPAFSPGGDRLTFTSDRGGDGFQIYLLYLASNQVTKVTHRAEGADQSRFSPDGELITFHSGASVYIIRPDGTEETLVATGLDSFNAYFWPAFSADGQQLVFDRNNEINAGQARRLRVPHGRAELDHDDQVTVGVPGRWRDRVPGLLRRRRTLDLDDAVFDGHRPVWRPPADAARPAPFAAAGVGS